MITPTATNFTREQKLLVLKRAIETVQTSAGWASGETKTIFKGLLQSKQAEVYLANGKDGVNLYLAIEGTLMSRFTSEPFKIGYFNVETGLVVSKTATESNYLQWNRQTNREIS